MDMVSKEHMHNLTHLRVLRRLRTLADGMLGNQGIIEVSGGSWKGLRVLK